jgi:hypothetical protein
MGNRGCLHDAHERIRRPWTVTRWIVCVLEFKGRRRPIMRPGHYTELFFLDEATALAAGHRPCAECQRERYVGFREHWAAARGLDGRPSADDMDAVLHAERLDEQGGKRTYRERVSRLPSGVIVTDASGHADLLQDGALRPWSVAGYGPARLVVGDPEVDVLTPRSVVAVIARGYPVTWHDSAEG